MTPATREKIKAIAKAQGYVYNMVAGSLRNGTSKTIAMVFGDIANPLFAMKMRKLEDIFRANGYQVLILNTDSDPDEEMKAIRTVISRHIDGVVFNPSL